MSGVELWVTAEEGAAIWKCHHETMLIYCKTIPGLAKKVGGKWLVYRPALDAPPKTAAAVEKPRRGRPRKKAA